MDENSIEIKTACIRYQPRLKQIVRIRQSTDEGITLEASPLKLFTVANLRYQLVVNTKLPCLNLIWDWQFFSVSGSNLSRYKVNSVAWVFHPFIIYFPSSVAHSHFDLYVCSHRLHVGAFLAEEPNFIRGVVVLILVAESLTFITIFNDLFTKRCA